MKKQIDVVMLPTEKANVGMIAKCIKDDFTNSFDRIGKLCLITNSKFYKPNIYWHSQHLYILSDEPIKDRDWVIHKNREVLQLSDVDEFAGIINDVGTVRIECCKKIIATTDESLTTEKQYKSGWDAKINLPRPSNEFLKKFCELGGVDKVLVEYEENLFYTNTKELNITNKLKVAPDNTITIYPIKL